MGSTTLHIPHATLNRGYWILFYQTFGLEKFLDTDIEPFGFSFVDLILARKYWVDPAAQWFFDCFGK